MTKEQIQDKISKRIIELLEEEIIDLANQYEHAPLEEYDQYERVIIELLRVRHYMMLKTNKIDNNGIMMVIEFNNNLRQALTELYYEAQSIYNSLKENFSGRVINIEPKLWIADEYPTTREDQSDRAKRIWEILLNPDLNEMYHNGCDNGSFDPTESLNHYLYLDEKLDNWCYDIAGLFDVDMPKDLMMVYAGHNLGSHTLFSIFELMHVRNFRKEIVVNIEEERWKE